MRSSLLGRLAVFLAAALLVLGAASAPSPPGRAHAQGLHLGVGAGDAELLATWALPGAVAPPLRPRCEVRWSDAASTPHTRAFAATSATYRDGHCSWCVPWTGVLLSARLQLADAAASGASSVHYRCGDDTAGLPTAWRTAKIPARARRVVSPTVSFVALGDVGSYAASLRVRQALLKEAERTPLEWVVFAGDLAYAGGNQSAWDTFAEAWEPLASAVPLLPVPGNRELLGRCALRGHATHSTFYRSSDVCMPNFCFCFLQTKDDRSAKRIVNFAGGCDLSL